jgi:hypothetical protein
MLADKQKSCNSLHSLGRMRRGSVSDLCARLHCAEGALPNSYSRVHRKLASAAFGAGLLATLVPSAAWCWETAHGPPDNTGFVDVVTKPAEHAIKTDIDIGTIAPGAGPVVAPDGTFYLGNEQGKLMSFKPDGTPGWSRNIAAGQRIVASPAIGSDGTIYVVGVSIYRDHRGGKSTTRVDGALHVFNSTGGYFGHMAFPEHNGSGGGTTASPNIWRFNNTEYVIVPAVYGNDVRLLAFPTSGGPFLDQHAIKIVAEVFGGPVYPWDFPASDGKNPGRNEEARPFPPVGIYTNPLGGTPFILVSNHDHDLVGFTLSAGSFLETFRVHEDDRFMRSAPAILPDRHAIIGTEDVERDPTFGPRGTDGGGVVFSGPNMNKLAPVTGLKAIWATPTRLADGRTALIRGPQMVVLDGRNVVTKIPLAGYSNASATASRTHLFVSTTDAIQTFDPASLTELSRMPWSEGGRSQPVISPLGYVYAVAGDALYVFPPSLKTLPPNRVVPQTGVAVVSTDTATQDSKPYKPPMTMSGNRLFACEELDGDDCGKGDYDTIATAFCKKEGFIGAGHIQVDNKKVKAETLDGRYCTKKKCKVFEQIICANN